MSPAPCRRSSPWRVRSPAARWCSMVRRSRSMPRVGRIRSRSPCVASGASWRKSNRAHTLDRVVLAAEWGHGRRTGKLSNLHLGARAPATGGYVMLGKTFKGLTDAMLEWQTTELLARETHRDQWTVYVRPELVVEIAFSDLQASSRYPGGLALRLARVKRYRDDKRAADADTIETVRRVYAARAAT